MSKSFKHRPLFAQNLPKEVTKPKIRWKAFPVIWEALKRAAMALGFLVLLQLVIVLLVVPVFFPKGAPPLPREMVLYLTLDDAIAETPKDVSFADPFAPPALTARQVVETLDRAALDDRVKGFVLRINSGGAVGVSHVQEIHEALKRYKASGKFAYVYSSSYGEGVGGLSRYYLASAFDEIWMQPLGVVSVGGFNAEIPYFRETLDKLGVKPEFFQRKDYKTAYESMTNKAMSDENREMVERLIDDIAGVLVADIARYRDMSSAAFEDLVDTGLLTGQEALRAGLITHADYADVMVGNIKESVTGSREAHDDLFVNFRRYAAAVKDKPLRAGHKNSVALVYASGAIVPSADQGGLGGDGVAAADEIASAILDAAENPAVRAVVLRIDSPGGSPTASETILRAVENAQARGKPVIVSMGATAASGGYWIAAYADQIFVQPTTITGSIGVVGGKFSLAEMWDKIGVNWDSVERGENASMWSMNEPFSESEAARFNVMLDTIYEAFVARVAKGRDMSPEDVDAIAGGRVWSGVRAVEIGLADQFGGLDAALDYAAQEIGRKSRADLNVVVMPKPKTALEQIVMMLEGQVALGRFMQDNAAVFDLLSPLSDAAVQARRPQDFMTYQDLTLR